MIRKILAFLGVTLPDHYDPREDEFNWRVARGRQIVATGNFVEDFIQGVDPPKE